MADLLSRAMQKGDPWDEADTACGWLKSQFPYIHQVLAGQRENGKAVAACPGSIRLFTNGGELKAEITGSDWIMRGYLVLPKEVGIIENLEKELASGRIGWTVKSERNDRLAKVPY